MHNILTAQIRRKPDRSVPEEFEAIMRAGRVAHFGFCENGAPVVIPLVYGYQAPGTIYLHGSRESRAIAHAGSGAPLCITVTELNGIVYSKQALTHSMLYRSAVCFGTGRFIEDHAIKHRAFRDMISRYIPDRTEGRDYSAPTAAHLDGVLFVEVTIECASAKARTVGPYGPGDDDPSVPGSAGILPL